MTEKQNINPQITEVEIGIRGLRKITIYPLSIPDQLKMTDLITKALQEFMTVGKGLEDIAVVSFIVGFIRENIGKILEMVTDDEKGKDLLKDMSNFQASEIAKTIFEVNYGSVLKNLEGLIEKMKSLFLSVGPLPQSVSDTEDTDLSTSTSDLSEKEE